MKRTTLLILSAALCAALLLTACAQPAATPDTTTPDTTAPDAATPDTTTPDATVPETPAETAVTYPLLVKADEALSADLDGDGADEEILYTVRTGDDSVMQAVVTVNGTEFAAELTEQGFVCDNPEAAYCCLTDIDSSDGLLEIAVMDAGPSDDPTTSFFHFADGALTYLGSAEGYAMNEDGSDADMGFHGFGTVNSFMRLSVLQTWWAKADYRLTNGTLTRAAQSSYTPNDRSATAVTVKADLAVYEDCDVTSEKTTVAAGSALTLGATDNAQWVMVTDENDDGYWMHLDAETGFSVELADGSFVPSVDALDGLTMAD